jgi:hypothetical protein
MNRSPGPEEFTNMDDQLTAIIMELRRHFERLYGERLVRTLLFGWQARGDAEPESDEEQSPLLLNVRREGIYV